MPAKKSYAQHFEQALAASNITSSTAVSPNLISTLSYHMLKCVQDSSCCEARSKASCKRIVSCSIYTSKRLLNSQVSTFYERASAYVSTIEVRIHIYRFVHAARNETQVVVLNQLSNGTVQVCQGLSNATVTASSTGNSSVRLHSNMLQPQDR